MTIGIDPEKLRKIAKDAITQKRSEKKSYEEEKSAEEIRKAARIKQKAEDIIASIPDELEKAAKSPKQTSSGIKIIATIPIVREHMTSIMDTKGDLSEEDAAILATVKEKLTTANPSDLYTLEIKQHSEQHQFTTNSGNDWSEYGPCIHYDLVVTTLLPK